MDFDFDFDFPSFGGVGSTRGCRGCGWFIFIALIAIAIIVISIAVYKAPYEDTKLITEQYARHLCHEKHPQYGEVYDAWDIEVYYDVEEIENPYATRCTVISAGRDREFGTDDDIVSVNHDFHKTKMASEWAGKKAKEALKGFAKGWGDAHE